jgi:hypothetical protein
VQFISRVNGSHADVSFGRRSDGTGEANVVRVPIDDLHRPEPPPRPWFLPGRIEQPKPPTPSSAEIIEATIAKRRDGLRAAHTLLASAKLAADTARTLADRARTECEGAHAALRELELSDTDAVEAWAGALRRGERPSLTNGHDREAMRHRVGVAEAALDSFNRELATANSKHAEASSNVRRAAAELLAAIVDQDAEELRELETNATRLRASLWAASMIAPSPDIGPIRIAPTTIALLESPPTQPKPSDASKYRALLDRLMDDPNE